MEPPTNTRMSSFGPGNKLSPSAQSFLRSPRPRRAGNFPSLRSPKPLRRALAYLSPNINRDDSSAKKAKKNSSSSALRRDISDVRARVAILNEKEEKAFDQGLLSRKEKYQQERDNQLDQLNTKLNSIQAGLDLIDSERKMLIEACEKLEKEKARYEKDLSMKEKEIAALSKRCSSQADKVKEASKIKSSNAALVAEMERLKKSLQESTSNGVNAENLSKELSLCLEAKGELEQQIERIKKDHADVSESLRLCLDQVKDMTRQKSEWEDERRRLERVSSLSLEKQRVEFERNTATLKDELRDYQIKVSELEKRLQVKVAEKKALKRDEESAIRKIKNELVAEQAQHEQCVAELKSEHELEISHLRQDFSEQLESMRDQLNDANGNVETLKDQLSNCMDELMTRNSELVEREEEAKLFCELTTDIEILQDEKSRMEDILLERDTEIAELSAEIIKLEIEQKLLDERSKRIDELESTIISQKKEKESLQSSSREEILSARSRIESLEEQLRLASEDHEASRQKVESEKTSMVRKLRTDLRDLLAAKDESEKHYRNTLDSKAKHISMLNQQVRDLSQSAMESSKQHQEEVTQLRKEVLSLKRELSLKDSELRDIKLIEIDEHEKTVAALRDQLKQSSQTRSVVEENAARVIGDLQEQISGLQQQLVVSDQKRDEARKYNEKLSSTLECLREDHKSTLDSLGALNKKTEDLRNERDEALARIVALEALVEETKNDVKTELELQKKFQDELRAVREKMASIKSEKDAFAATNRARRLELEKSRRDLNNSEKMLVQKDDEIASLETLLQERTTLLTTMVDQNKMLKNQVSEQSEQHSVLAGEIRDLQYQLIEKEDEAKQLKSQASSRQTELEEILHEEQMRRELVEKELESLRPQCASLRRSAKGILDLQKENDELRSKVQRQEAYLKRKLEKEKASRRGAVPSVSGIKPPTKSSILRKTSSSRSKESSVTLDTSMDMELDSLLE